MAKDSVRTQLLEIKAFLSIFLITSAVKASKLKESEILEPFMIILGRVSSF